MDFPYRLTCMLLCFNIMHSYHFLSVIHLLQRFGLDLPVNSVEDEFTDYSLSPSSDLPPYSKDGSLLDFCYSMADMTLPSGDKRYQYLPDLAIVALTLPHSNAATERCFSIVRKVQTDFRGNLSNETLGSLLSVKLNSDTDCYKRQPSKQLINSAKRACVAYNESLHKE